MSTANFSIPFIPQEGITQGILGAIQMANQQHAQQQEAAAKQQSLQIAQQEADTASKNLAMQAPHVAASTANLQATTALTQTELAQRQASIAFLNGTSQSPDVDPNHVDQLTSQIAGPHAQPLDVSNPIGQTLAAPQAPPPDGSSPAQAAPASTATPKRGVDAYIDALNKKVGLLPEELDAINNAKTLAAPTGDVAGFQKTVEGIIAKRNDPTYARYVGLRQQGLSADAAHQKIATIDATNTALNKLATDPDTLTNDKAPAAVSQLQGMLKDPDLDPLQKPRVQGLLTTAKLAVQQNLAFDAAKAKAVKAAQDGDPVTAGHLLATGQVAPNEITTGRNSEFAVRAFQAAQKENPNFNVQKAQADFDVAKSPTNVGFFGSAKSLTDPGGTLDQLIAAGARLPSNQLKVVNSLDNAAKAQFSGGAQAHYASTALSVSDDLAKVLGGGVGTDASRAEAKSLVDAALAQGARKEAVQGIRDGVDSQMSSRIGDNSVLRNMYGKNVSPSKSSDAAAGGSKVYHYDAQGNLVP